MYTMWLLYQLWERINELQHRPPVTIALIVLNMLIFAVGGIGKDLFSHLSREFQELVLLVRPVVDVRAACVLPAAVVGRGEFRRLVISAFVHVDEIHLLYNMLSFVHKGVTLESQMGSANFAGLVVYLAFAESILYCAVAYALSALGFSLSLWNSCAVGFSGILFGLGAVLSSSSRNREAARNIFGLPAPNFAVATLMEVVTAQVLTPHASFTGHLCGALAGLSFVLAAKYVGTSSSRRRQTSFGSGTSGYRGTHAHGE